jgi:predicted trehalose synthase
VPEPAALAAARWFGGGGQTIAAVETLDALVLPGGSRLEVLEVLFADGQRRLHLWVEGEDRVAGGVLDALIAGGDRGRFAFHPGARLPGLAPAGRDERAVAGDQSNTSRIVGGTLVVKLYRRLWPGVHPEIELGRHLTESAGFAGVPAYAGAVLWDGHAVALVQELVSGGRDGWDWAAEAVRAGDVSRIGELGELSHRLHTALAQLGSAPATPAERRRRRDEAHAQLDLALALADAESAAQLRRHEPRIRTALDLLETGPAPLLTRVHGDYHIGQILLAPAGLSVLDFEGEPTRDLAERAARSSPVRDVAAMLRSFDHLVRFVQRGAAAAERAQAAAWIEPAREAFLSGYGRVPPTLLHAFEVEKETYEFVYAARYLPDWAYAPRAGLAWLMEGE